MHSFLLVGATFTDFRSSYLYKTKILTLNNDVMKEKFYLLFIVLFAVGFVACSDDDPKDDPKYPKVEIELTTNQEVINQNTQEFAWKLFGKVCEADILKRENILISPLSINYAMGMLQNGAAGETVDEILKVLGLEGQNVEDINEFYKFMKAEMGKVDRSIALETANSFWYRNDVQFKDEFIATIKSYYDAKVSAEDFKDPKTIKIINKWCADNTNGKIEEIIDEIPQNMISYLLNAIYFKGKWEQQFSKKNTKTATFTLADKTTVDAQFMSQTISSSAYFENDILSYSELNFGNGAYQMFFALPKENVTTRDVLNLLTNRKLNFETIKQSVYYELPKFEIEYKIDLIPTLSDLGMANIFKVGANFSKLADMENCVGLLLQKTYLKIDEEGGEAAAVTVVGEMTTADQSMPIVPFKLDRPFIYGIRETSTGTILFIGHLANPVETK